MPDSKPDAESNLYQLKRQLAAERAGDDSVASPDRSRPGFDRQRPLLSGAAVGPKGNSYGTLGAPVRVENPDDAPEWMHWSESVEAGEVLLTTNRHVLDGRVGSPVYQPGHRTSDSNRIGGLVGFAELTAESAPDVAFIRLDPAREWGGYLDADGMGQEVYRGDGADLPGTPSRLAGATSGTTTGEVQKVDRVARVNYGARGVIPKRGVYRASDNSQGGDSGAPSDGGSGGDGAIHGLNFASTSGFDPAGTEGRSWKVPVGLIEECGVRVLANSGVDPQNTVVIRGSGPDAGYQVFFHERDDGDTPQPSTLDGASINAGDTVRRTREGEPGDWVAEGIVAGGADAWTCWRQVARIESEDPDVQFDVHTSKGEWARGLDPGRYGTDPGPRDGPPEGPPPEPGAWTPPAKLFGRRINERPTWGIVDRHPHTTEARTRTIREDVGAWKGDESSDELGSIQAAANYLPTEIRHALVIQLTGHHDGEPGDAITMSDHDVAATRSAHVHIQGDGDDRGACVVDAKQINTQFDAGPPRSVGFHDCTIRGCVTTYGGVVGFSNVDLSPGRAPEGWVVAGYGGYVSLNNCDVSGESLAKFKNGREVELVNTSVDVSGPLCESGVGGGVLVIDTGCDISAERVRPKGWDVSPVRIHDPHGALNDVWANDESPDDAGSAR